MPERLAREVGGELLFGKVGLSLPQADRTTFLHLSRSHENAFPRHGRRSGCLARARLPAQDGQSHRPAALFRLKINCFRRRPHSNRH